MSETEIESPAAAEENVAAVEESKESKEPKEPQVPESLDFNEFQAKSAVDLYEIGNDMGLKVGGNRSKHQLVFDIVGYYARRGTRVEAQGVLELNGDHGFLRWPAFNFESCPENLYVSRDLIREYRMRDGQLVRGLLRVPREREKYLGLQSVISVEGIPAEEWEPPASFDKLTPLFPNERIILENEKLKSESARVIDIVSPLGKGQRGMIAAPPRGGKTVLLKHIACAIHENHPEIELIILLLDERPEEVTDFKETVDASVFSSTFDEPGQRHVQVADTVIERAKRMVEMKKDVVILLDSLTRLARGHNRLTGGKGGIMSGGVHSQALQKPRKFFGSARNVEEGGSLTILATALIETQSRMDEVIFEEFKGTGNMELFLDNELVGRRIFPAIHVMKSGTRQDEMLYHKDENARIQVIRKQLAAVPAVEAMDKLLKNIRATSSNAELLMRGLR